jgi:hypothetical protein
MAHILDHAIEVLEKKLVEARDRYDGRPNRKHKEAVDSFTEAIAVLKAKRAAAGGE